MEETLDRALASLLRRMASPGPLASAVAQAAPARQAGGDATVNDLASQALDRFRRAQERLKAGDFAGYGQELKEMEQALERLRQKTGSN